METGKYRTLKPRDMPVLLSQLMRATLYIVALAVLGLTFMMVLDAPAPRGTLLWLSQNGIPIGGLIGFTATCGVLGVALTHRVRRHLWRTLALFFIVTLPYIGYAAAASFYVIGVIGGSRITAWMYFFGYLFAFLLVLFVALLSAWTEVSSQFKGGD